VPHLFPVYHVPGYPSVRAFDGATSAQVREHWAPLFERAGVRVAFENHDHAYKRTHPIRAGAATRPGSCTSATARGARSRAPSAGTTGGARVVPREGRVGQPRHHRHRGADRDPDRGARHRGRGGRHAARAAARAAGAAATTEAAGAGARRWLAGDHHIHSRYSVEYDDSTAPPTPIIAGDARYPIPTNAAMARKHGLAWMVSTDHGGPNHSKLNLEQAYPELVRSRTAVPEVVQFYGMEFDTPGADHSSLIVPHSHGEQHALHGIERRFSKRDAWPRDSRATPSRACSTPSATCRASPSRRC
jgi:hypothetical protein